MSRDPNIGYVIAAYVFAFVMLAGMIGAVWADYLRLKRSLAELARQRAGQTSDLPASNRQDQDPAGGAD